MTLSEKDRDTLIKYRIEQAHEAIEDAELSISHHKLKMAVNRIYYGMFYILSALALKYKFKTSKHQGLIGLIENMEQFYVTLSTTDLRAIMALSLSL
jgi:uncharacterized protein (UPF0332 family)